MKTIFRHTCRTLFATSLARHPLFPPFPPVQTCRRALFATALAWLLLTGPSPAQVATPAPALRMWTDQLGRTVKGALVSVSDAAVVLRLENGAQTTVPLAVLSKPDQLFIQQQKPLSGAVPSAVPAAAPIAPSTRPMTWPALVTVDPKALNIVTGKQDAAHRQFQYESGSFEFTSNAPLAGSVIKDMALDFELIRTLFDQLPWGWQPKPKAGPYFRVFLTEEQEDFTALGGLANSTGGSKDDYIYKKLSSLGLVRVGQRYAFDAMKKEEGDVLGLTFRLVMGEMRSLHRALVRPRHGRVAQQGCLPPRHPALHRAGEAFERRGRGAGPARCPY